MNARPHAGGAGAILLVTVALLGTMPRAASAAPWPGESWGAATDLTALNPVGWSTNLSGAYWNPATRRLWVCINNPARFWSLRENGPGFAIEREYTGAGDLEAITQIATLPDRVFVLDEQARTIRSYRISDGAALTSWFLSTITDWGNNGPEGLAFVPNAWLAANAFVDGSGAPYPQSVHGANGFGGLMFVAVQTSGWVYAFDLRNDGTHTFVGRYLTSRAESCELTFDDSVGRLYVLHNIDGNWVQITDLSSTLPGSARQLTTDAEVQVPSGSNIEGFALTPAVIAGAVGDRWCFFTDDSNAQGALRWFKQLHSTLEKQEGDGQTADAGAPVPIAPAVQARDPFANRIPGLAVTFTVASGGGSVTGSDAMTDTEGVATVGNWVLGAAPGANSLTGEGPGLSGSPQTFTATGIAPLGVDPPGDVPAAALSWPAPNPGHGSLLIPFALPAATPITLEIFDLRGRHLRTVAEGAFPAGAHAVLWDGRRSDGTRVSTGVYFYRLRLPGMVLVRRGLLIR